MDYLISEFYKQKILIQFAWRRFGNMQDQLSRRKPFKVRSVLNITTWENSQIILKFFSVHFELLKIPYWLMGKYIKGV